MKQRIVLIASVLIGLLAFWLTGDHLQRERARLYAGAVKSHADGPHPGSIPADDVCLLEPRQVEGLGRGGQHKETIIVQAEQ